jgi:hypothetical protein
MGRKKPFIDKKKATTYHVVFKEEDDADVPYELVSTGERMRRMAEAASQQRHHLSFLYEDEDDMVKTEDDRQEILSMGFPDDGYNYLKHLRTVGVRRQVQIMPVARLDREEEQHEDPEGVS